nr:hypothetical protein BaRGS_003627 [Batillaria attramentaria]
MLFAKMEEESRRQAQEREKPDLIGDNIPGDRTGKYIKNLDLIKPAEDVDKLERAAGELQTVRARVTGSHHRPTDSKKRRKETSSLTGGMM